MEHTMLLHDRQELDNDLGARPNEDLALAGLLGVVHGIERIVQNRSADHFGGWGSGRDSQIEPDGSEVSNNYDPLPSKQRRGSDKSATSSLRAESAPFSQRVLQPVPDWETRIIWTTGGPNDLLSQTS